MLDTDVLIDVSRGSGPVLVQVRSWILANDELGVCPVQIAEFFAGVHPAQRSAQRAFFAALTNWSVTREAAIQAGVYRYDFARQAIQIQTPVAIIAAVAREQAAVVVTRNARHFPMTDVRVHQF